MFRKAHQGAESEHLHDNQFEFSQVFLARERRMLFLRGPLFGTNFGPMSRVDSFSPTMIGDDILSMNIDDPKAPIYLTIDSPGGDVGAGMILYDLIRMSRAPIVTVAQNCASGDTRVRTEFGAVDISELVNGRRDIKVRTMRADGTLGLSPITNWFKNARAGRAMVRVSLRHARGYGAGRGRVDVTEDHRILTPTGWVRAGQLKTGDLTYTGENAPNNRQAELIDGTMLGDASIDRYARLKVGHVDVEYAGLKQTALASLGATLKTTVKADRLWALVYQPSSNWTRQQRRRWYGQDGVKRVPLDLTLTPFIVAVWFMDDGCMTASHGAKLSVEGFGDADIGLLSDRLRDIGVENTVSKDRFISIPQASARALAELIRPFVPQSMSRKVLGHTAFDSANWELGEAVPGIDTAVISRPNRVRDTVYCIEIADTHNFVGSIGVLENCASMATVLMAAGHERVMYPHSRVMLHLPKGAFEGDSETFEVRSKELGRVRDELVDCYVECGVTANLISKSGRRPTKAKVRAQIIKDINRSEFWMTADECVAYGLVDRIATRADILGETKKYWAPDSTSRKASGRWT